MNAGISGNRLLRHGFGLSALARFDRDVLSMAGVRWMTVLLGINDITFPAVPGMPPAEAVTADDLIWGFRQLIERAHAHDIKAAGATIMPIEGVNTYTESGEAIRQTVNRWIRSSGAFDAVIDFDAAVRDPAHPGRLRAGFDPGITCIRTTPATPRWPPPLTCLSSGDRQGYRPTCAFNADRRWNG